MSLEQTTPSPADPRERAQLASELREGIARAVGALVDDDEEAAQEVFEGLMVSARTLVERRRTHTGTRHDTRDLLVELMFARLREGFSALLGEGGGREPRQAAEWVMGALFGIKALGDIGAALDHTMLETSTSREFSFAGRADFISVEEVLQMLAAGKRNGVVTLEKSDNRLDVYLSGGRIAFLDPVHLVRRVLPGRDGAGYKEIPADALGEAEQRRSQEGIPVVLALQEAGQFRPEEVGEVMRTIGREIFYEFLRDQESSAFFYRAQAEMPAPAARYDMMMSVTPLLLEASKKLDDWKSMLQVFPDPHEPVQPQPDMIARIGDLELGVLEIRLLTQIDGSASAHDLAERMGLPLHDLYQQLVRLAREGAIVVPGGLAALEDLSMSVEESMEMAFECLDANDDKRAVSSALDRVLGGEDEEPGDGGSDDVGRDFIRSLQNR